MDNIFYKKKNEHAYAYEFNIIQNVIRARQLVNGRLLRL